MSETTRKQEVKTVKQSTVVIGVVFAVALVASFLAGFFTHIQYVGQVQEDASSMVTKLSKDQK